MTKLSRRSFFCSAVIAASGSALRAQQGRMRVTTDDGPFKTPAEPANSPIGAGKGIHPGRVVWAHDPKAAVWDGDTGSWWDDEATDPRRVDAMMSWNLQTLTGEKSGKAAWDRIFKYSNDARGLGSGGYKAGDRIAVKLNSNQDRPGAWRFGAGMPTPQVVYSLVNQLITEAGVPGKDITLYDASRYIGDPIFDRIRANPDPNFPPLCVTGAKHHINVTLARAHSLMGITAAAKNLFGAVYFEGRGFTPEPLHDFASRDRKVGTYNALADLFAFEHLGRKTILNITDNFYAAEHQNRPVLKYESFGGHWCSSLSMSQDPVAMDSVSLDILRNEPRAEECRGFPENYLHEAALSGSAPSGTVYNPNPNGEPVESLGVHEHWNNAKDKQYSRNLGKREGIELVTWTGGSKA